MNEIRKRKESLDSLSSYGVAGLISALISVLLIISSLRTWQEKQKSIYFIAHPNVVGLSNHRNEMFRTLSRTTYTENLTYKSALEHSDTFYFTENCQMADAPTMLSFRLPIPINQPRNIYLTMNLREGYSNLNGINIRGQVIGHIVLEFTTENKDENFYYLELIAGKNIREWVIGAEDNGIEIVKNISPGFTHEGYRGLDLHSGLDAVIDIATFQIPYDVPDAPLIGVWVMDETNGYLGSCNPGIQVMSVIVEAPRGANEQK